MQLFLHFFSLCGTGTSILRSAMLWDVMGGVARRSWARNPHAMETSDAFNESHSEGYHITMPYLADDELIKKTIKEAL